MPGYRDPNRNTRAPFARADEPRDLGPSGTGDVMRDGYAVIARTPRLPDYPDYVSPSRAKQIEDTYRQFSEVEMIDFDPAGEPDGDFDD